MDYTIREIDFIPITGESGMYWWHGIKCDLGWNPIEQIRISIANEMDMIVRNPIGYVFIDDDDNLIPVTAILPGQKIKAYGLRA